MAVEGNLRQVINHAEIELNLRVLIKPILRRLDSFRVSRGTGKILHAIFGAGRPCFKLRQLNRRRRPEIRWKTDGPWSIDDRKKSLLFDVPEARTRQRLPGKHYEDRFSSRQMKRYSGAIVRAIIVRR